MKISYNTKLNAIQYNVAVAASSYVAIGYGINMDNTNMVLWIANGANSA